MLVFTLSDVLGLVLLGGLIVALLAILAGRVMANVGRRVASWFDEE